MYSKAIYQNIMLCIISETDKTNENLSNIFLFFIKTYLLGSFIVSVYTICEHRSEWRWDI